MNRKNFKAALARTKKEAKLGLWDQTAYAGMHDCNSPHCFIGWAAILAGFKPSNPIDIWEVAMEWLDITSKEETWLARETRTLDDFRLFLKHDGIPDGE